ncbi:hypothetical protein J3U16_06420 [Gilliamella sp. B3023]|uniref:hypothetical protein n=1 Tax=Gilliamella sp. B3023 TaxID=2817987 RepID=UPI00226A124F|nr:hypothetical protein [Gilliamella sp. B3023]MCX8674923.1 hypothetical protein [Gilliamella sp. B3023]
MKKKFKQRKQHYFLFAYKFQCTNGRDGYGCKTVSQNTFNVTQSTFDYVSELARNSIDSYVDSILITSASYLGYMTEKEFYDKP